MRLAYAASEVRIPHVLRTPLVSVLSLFACQENVQKKAQKVNIFSILSCSEFFVKQLLM